MIKIFEDDQVISDNLSPDFINTLRPENVFAVFSDNYVPGSHLIM